MLAGGGAVDAIRSHWLERLAAVGTRPGLAARHPPTVLQGVVVLHAAFTAAQRELQQLAPIVLDHGPLALQTRSRGIPVMPGIGVGEPRRLGARLADMASGADASGPMEGVARSHSVAGFVGTKRASAILAFHRVTRRKIY